MNYPTKKIRAIFFGESWPRQWFGILGLIILFVSLRWNNFDSPLTRDEGEYAYAAQLLAHGLAPYEHAFIQKPPMVFYSYAFADFFLPHVFWAPRLLAGVFTALATILLGYIARLEFGKGFALPVMWLVTPLLLLPEIEQFTANTEMFMLLPLLATVAVYCHSRQHGHLPKHWFAAGFLAATTLLYKYTALPVLLFIFVIWSAELWCHGKKFNFFSRCWFSAFLGGSAAAVLILGFFLRQDGGARFWECTVLFNHYYAASSNFRLAAFWSRIGEFWSAWWILFLVPLAIFWQPKPRVWFWIGIFFCALLATGASAYGHYYLIVMPFWALLSAAGIGVLAKNIARWLPGLDRFIFFTIAAFVVFLELKPDLPWLLCTREHFAEAKMSGWSPFLESPLVAKRIDELSSPDDTVFIAGSEPQILCYAQRFSASRFITAYPLMIPTPVALGYQREAIEDLRQHPPALIVSVQLSTSWLRQESSPLDFFAFLNRFLKQNYEPVGGYVPDGDKSRWSEPLTDEESANASVVLFRRKK
jgi:hypothetical protein